MLAWLRRHRNNVSLELPGPEDIIEFEEDTDPLPEQVYHDAARHFLDAQITSFNQLDTRSSQIFSVGSVALPLAFALLNLGSGRVDIPNGAKWMLLAGLLIYLLLLICVFIAGTVRTLDYRPNIARLREYSEDLPGAALLRWAANEYQESTEANTEALGRKSWWVGAATFLLYIEGALLAMAALWTLDLIGGIRP